ncbi:hypothetical protein UCMB321_4276 [Pseudomonas batumici]|uniref:Uncharacterized protein n=1 Tax=Pseudomonas batumici TaxID=226910 RepID=A0A0C2HXT6_9PSED|nr:hypothetical protein UCMB321_4276 [Pseudomonas batumici]
MYEVQGQLALGARQLCNSGAATRNNARRENALHIAVAEFLLRGRPEEKAARFRPDVNNSVIRLHRGWCDSGDKPSCKYETDHPACPLKPSVHYVGP